MAWFTKFSSKASQSSAEAQVAGTGKDRNGKISARAESSHSAHFEKLEGRQMFSVGGSAIAAEYAATAHESDAFGACVQQLLGDPTSGVVNVPGVAGAQMQKFQGSGAIYWSPGTGAHVVFGQIGSEYAQTAHETDAYGKTVQSVLGLPTSDETSLNWWSVSQTNTFQGGVIDWSPTTGAHAVIGGINTAFQSKGGAGNYIALPTSDEQGTSSHRTQNFQDGYMDWRPNVPAQWHQTSVSLQSYGNQLEVFANGVQDYVVIQQNGSYLNIMADGQTFNVLAPSGSLSVITNGGLVTNKGRDTVGIFNTSTPTTVWADDGAPTFVINRSPGGVTYADQGDNVDGGTIHRVQY